MRFFRHHRNNKFYELLSSSATNEGDGAPVVVYQDVASKAVYVRPKKEFFGTVSFMGREEPRFQEYIPGKGN